MILLRLNISFHRKTKNLIVLLSNTFNYILSKGNSKHLLSNLLNHLVSEGKASARLAAIFSSNSAKRNTSTFQEDMSLYNDDDDVVNGGPGLNYFQSFEFGQFDSSFV